MPIFTAPSQYLMLLDNRRLCLCRWQRGEILPVADFPAEEAKNLETWLKEHPKGLCKPVSFVVNLAEEEFRLERLPRLRGSERKDMLEYRLKRFFPETPYLRDETLGYGEDLRPEEEVIFHALIHPERLNPWLEILKARQIALLGIYSLSQAAGALLKTRHVQPVGQAGQKGAFCGDTPYAFIFTRHESGWRQTFVKNGKTVFSRLAPICGIPADEALYLAEEAQRLRRYLLGQRAIKQDDALSIYLPSGLFENMPDVLKEGEKAGFIPIHWEDMPYLESAAAPESGFHGKGRDGGNRDKVFSLENPLAHPSANLPEHPPLSYADIFFLRQIALNPPKSQFAPFNERYRPFFTLLKRGFFALGLAALLSGAFYLNRWQESARQWQRASEQLLEKSRHKEAEIAENSSKTENDFPVSPENLKAMLNLYDKLSNPPGCPQLFPLGKTLDQHPEITLERLYWHCGTEDAPALIVEGSLAAANSRELLENFTQILKMLEQDGMTVEILSHPADIGVKPRENEEAATSNFGIRIKQAGDKPENGQAAESAEVGALRARPLRSE